ncbi:MAG: cytidine deaminase [Actinobacteria bacterium]|nr:cytidine deaminase [Actinomycetota bacterium]
MEHELAGVIEAAKQARKHAYASYSNFKVGAAVLCPDGTMFSGANVENAVYGESICAERVAIFNAVSEGRREFTAMAVVCGGEEPCCPCGSCRQVFVEFNPDMTVIMASMKGTHILEMKASDLLPHAFMPERLEEGRRPEAPEPPGPRAWP